MGSFKSSKVISCFYVGIERIYNEKVYDWTAKEN